jgi:hypothetical protein
MITNTAPQIKNQKVIIISLAILLGLSLILNIGLGLISLGVFKPANSPSTYTTYSDGIDLDNKSYIGELVQFRVRSDELLPGKTKNEYIWKYAGRNYGVVLRFPDNLRPVTTSTGLYMGKYIARAPFENSSLPVVQIESVKG